MREREESADLAECRANIEVAKNELRYKQFVIRTCESVVNLVGPYPVGSEEVVATATNVVVREMLSRIR